MSMRTSTFRFGPVRQETGSKHVRQGDLLEAINVRQTAKAGVYAKRKAFKRTAQAFVGGTLSGSPVSVLPGVNGNSLMRDSGGQLWTRDSATNSWLYSGKVESLWPETHEVQTGLYTNPKAFSCIVGSNLWVFALSSSSYEFTVVDAVTKQIITAKTTVTATNIAHASAAYDGSSVWVFWTDAAGNGTIRCHKIDPASPTTAPTLTTYYTFPSSPVNLSFIPVLQVQARYFSSVGKVFVVACGGYSAIGAMHSVLDPATGLAVSVGSFAAKTSVASASGGSTNTPLGALYILDGQDGSGSNWYYTLAGMIDTSGHQKIANVKVSSANLSTVAISSTNHPYDALPGYAITMVGVQDSVHDQQYLLTTGLGTGNPGWGDVGNVYGSALYGATSGSTPVVVSAGFQPYQNEWTVSGFAKIGTRWIAIMAFDDYGWCTSTTFGSESLSLQRSFHIHELLMNPADPTTASLSLIGQYEMGSGSALFGMSSSNITFPPSSPIVASVAPIHAVSGEIISAHSIASSVTGYVDIACTTVRSDKVYGKDTQLGSRAYAPGNIAMTWSAASPAHPLTPLMAPPCVKVVAGTGSDFVVAAFVYAYYDSDGTVWRSSPYVLNATIGHGAVFRVPFPSIMRFGNVLAGLEVYLGTTASPKLQAVVQLPSAGTAYFSYTTPTAATMVNGETLYSTGNAPTSAWPIPCQAVGTWRNRLFLAQGNKLYPSFEVDSGRGPMFNETQLSIWGDESGDITAINPVDWNYLALISEGQTAVVSGDGPNGIGVGNYVVRTLPSMTGVVAGGQATQGANGCYYQNKQTGRLMCVTPDLRVTECAGGAYDYSSYLITSAAWYEQENLMVFFAPASNAAIVIDYQHPQEAVPFGQVYLWTFAAGLVPAAACRDDSGLLVVSSLGSIYRTTTSQWVDDNASGTTDTYQMKLATAELQLGDLQGSFNLNKLQALLTMRGASGVTIGVYPGYASATAADPRTTTVSIDLPAPTNSGDTESVMTRPANCMRIQSFRVVILEKAGVTTQSFEFEGVATECFVTGKLLRPSEGRVI